MSASYVALRAIAALVAFMPRSFLAPLGRVIGWLAGSVLRIRRSGVEAAMVRASVQNAPIVAKQMYATLGRGAVELLFAVGRSRSTDFVTIDEDLVRAIDEALAASRPLIFFASHTGNWELAAAAAARLLEARNGRKLVVVAKPMSDRGTDAFLARLRASLGIVTIPPTDALQAAKRALDSGDVVVMPIDQVPDAESHARRISFLGTPALVDRAPAALAWRSRATALVVATDTDGRVRLLTTLRASESDPRAWIDEATASATSALASFVEKEPASWLWLHRRWKRAELHQSPRSKLPPLIALDASKS